MATVAETSEWVCEADGVRALAASLIRLHAMYVCICASIEYRYKRWLRLKVPMCRLHIPTESIHVCAMLHEARQAYRGRACTASR